MGFLFGNVLPLLVMSAVSMVPCGTIYRSVLHGLALFAYMYGFSFTYYTLQNWSYMACLAGGLGAYALLALCADTGNDHAYAVTYMSIANVTTAIIARMVIEGFFRRDEPRDIANAKFKEMGSEIIAAFDSFFDPPEADSLEKTRSHLSMAMESYEEQIREAPNTDSKLDIAQGQRTNYKLELYTALLGKARLILADLEMLQMALSLWTPLHKGHLQYVYALGSRADLDQKQEEEDIIRKESKGGEVKAALLRKQEKQKDDIELYSLLSDNPGFEIIKTDVVGTLRACFAVNHAILVQDKEDAISRPEVDKLKDMSGIMELDGVQQLYAEINHKVEDNVEAYASDIPSLTASNRVRLTVAVRALRHATRHAGEMDQLGLRELIHG